MGGEVCWAVRTDFARILPEVYRDSNEFGPRRYPCRLSYPNAFGPSPPPSPLLWRKLRQDLRKNPPVG